MFVCRRDSLLLREDGELAGDCERSSNLPCLGSLVGGMRRRCVLTDDETNSLCFITSVCRLMTEIGRLHRPSVNKV